MVGRGGQTDLGRGKGNKQRTDVQWERTEVEGGKERDQEPGSKWGKGSWGQWEEAEADGNIVFHAGTSEKDGHIYTNGGRVLGVVAKADGIKEAVDSAYASVDKIHFKAAHFRHDIAHWALERLKK